MKIRLRVIFLLAFLKIKEVDGEVAEMAMTDLMDEFPNVEKITLYTFNNMIIYHLSDSRLCSSLLKLV